MGSPPPMKQLPILIILALLLTACGYDEDHKDTPFRFYSDLDWFKEKPKGKMHSIYERNDTTPPNVYITTSGNGECYHRLWCQTIEHSDVERIPVDEAINEGFRPCRVCQPPTH